MQVSNIGELDGKMMAQLHKLLVVAAKEMKFSLADARIANESIQWYEAFLKICADVQKKELEAKKKPQVGTPAKTEGLGSLNVKEFNPGTPIKSTPSRKKSKTTTKRKK